MMSDAGIAPIQAAAATAQDVNLLSYSYSGIYYLYYPRNGLMQTESYPSGYTYLPGLFSGLSYSIAHNTQSILSAIPSYTTYIDGIEGTLTNIYSRLATTNSYIDGIEGYVDQIESYVDNVESSLTGILSAIQNQSLTIPQSLLDDVDSLDSTQSNFYNAVGNPNSSTGWGTYIRNNPTFQLKRYRQTSNGGTTADIDRTITDWNPLNQIWFWLYNINDSNILAYRDLLSGVFANPANPPQWLDKDLNATTLPRTSLWFDVRTIGVNINNILARLGYVLANDEDIAARQAAAATTDAAIDDFISGSGDASVSAGDLGSLASFTKSVTSSSAAPVDPSMIIQSIDSSSPWIWFTNDVLYSLEPTSSQRNQAKYSGSNSTDTPLLDSNLIDIQKALGLYDDR